MSAAVSKQASKADVDNVNDKIDELSDNDSDEDEPFEELNFNSNNGNDLADEDMPLPTICLYGNNGMAGPLDLNVRQNNELPDNSHCECNVTTAFSELLCYCLLIK